jgi:hypothetical protein
MVGTPALTGRGARARHVVGAGLDQGGDAVLAERMLESGGVEHLLFWSGLRGRRFALLVTMTTVVWMGPRVVAVRGTRDVSGMEPVPWAGPH